MIDFMRFRLPALILASVLMVSSILLVVVFGLKLGIDFTGGTEIRVQTLLPVEELREILVETTDLQIVPLDDGEMLLKMQPRTQEEQTGLIDQLQIADSSIRILTTQTIGPIAGRDLLIRALTAAVIATVGILLLIGLRFSDLRLGLAAVIALLHDVLIIVGTFSLLGVLLGVEVDVLFVTALLTILSLSVHDTIVVFDRVRELKKTTTGIGITEMVNTALTQTLTRSINNSLTMIFMLTAMLILGGESLRWFVFALLIGTLVGTYSSFFVAAPAYITLEMYAKKRKLVRSKSKKS